MPKHGQQHHMDDDDLKAADRADRAVFFCALVIALWLWGVW